MRTTLETQWWPSSGRADSLPPSICHLPVWGVLTLRLSRASWSLTPDRTRRGITVRSPEYKDDSGVNDLTPGHTDEALDGYSIS